jgi:hypothetical protein
MEKYINQLLEDIAFATENASFPSTGNKADLWDWMSDEEEDNTAPVRSLEEWTGLRKEMLPPSEMLDDAKLKRLLEALIKMLDAYNCSFVLQIKVPERIQYNCIRDNFDQDVKVKQWHMGFFKLCRPATEHKTCALGEFCECALFAELFKNFVDEDLSPEEERARYLEMEVLHLKRKYGDEWMKYYPYHLDPDYDDEYGNPYDYGFGDLTDDEDDDDWWKK